jgi:hypothetical protein
MLLSVVTNISLNLLNTVSVDFGVEEKAGSLDVITLV